MVDVNEEIVKAYFEWRGFIVKTSHYYKKYGPRGGAGPADIDLIMVHPIGDKDFGKFAIVSVKGWQNFVLKKSNFDDNVEDLKFDIQEMEAAKEFLGKNKFSKILVFSKIKPEDKEWVKNKFNKFDMKILDFKEIILELLNKLNMERNYPNSEFLQTLRILKKYFEIK